MIAVPSMQSRRGWCKKIKQRVKEAKGKVDLIIFQIASCGQRPSTSLSCREISSTMAIMTCDGSPTYLHLRGRVAIKEMNDPSGSHPRGSTHIIQPRH